MENFLKVLLSVDGNNYKITIKTRNQSNAVPFSEFKYFLDDKQKQLFNDAQYIWKIYDNDFGEYVTLEENSLIYNLSKLKAVKVSNDCRPAAPAAAVPSVPQTMSQVEPMQIDRDSAPMNGILRNRELSYYGQQQQPSAMAANNPYNSMPQQAMLNNYGYQRYDNGGMVNNAKQSELDLRDFVTANSKEREALYMQHRPAMSNSYTSPELSNYTRSSDPYSRTSDLRSYDDDRYMRSDPYGRGSGSSRSYDSLSRSDPYSRSDLYGRGDKDSFLHVLPLERGGLGGDPYSSYDTPGSLYQSRSSGPLSREYRNSEQLNRSYPSSLLPYSDSRYSDRYRESAGFTGSITKRAEPTYNSSNRNRVLSTFRNRSPERRTGDYKILPRKSDPKSNSATKLNAASQSFRYFLKIENIPQKRDLVKAVEKYNDEFETLASVENLWETNRIWNFVAKEMGTAKQVLLLRDCRKMFKDLFEQYKKILNNPKEWHLITIRNDIWPFFDNFHKKLNLKPFDKNIEPLKKSFDDETRKLKKK